MECMSQNPPEPIRKENPFTALMDLASDRLGGKALDSSDDFFAHKENLIKSPPAIFIPDKFTENGKWMDGWESRRKRNIDSQSHDWCVVRLGAPGTIQGINIDTSFFTGNFPEQASLEAGFFTDEKELLYRKWTEILPRSTLAGGSDNFFVIKSTELFSHVRLNIFPDGGVAPPGLRNCKTPLGKNDPRICRETTNCRFGRSHFWRPCCFVQ